MVFTFLFCGFVSRPRHGDAFHAPALPFRSGHGTRPRCLLLHTGGRCAVSLRASAVQDAFFLLPGFVPKVLFYASPSLRILVRQHSAPPLLARLFQTFVGRCDSLAIPRLVSRSSKILVHRAFSNTPAIGLFALPPSCLPMRGARLFRGLSPRELRASSLALFGIWTPSTADKLPFGLNADLARGVPA